MEAIDLKAITSRNQLFDLLVKQIVSGKARALDIDQFVAAMQRSWFSEKYSHRIPAST